MRPAPLLAALALAGAACKSPLPPPEQPGAADAYRAALGADPKGPRAGEARKRLEQVEFERARQAGTILALRSFLSEFPGGPHAREAGGLLEAARWAEAERQGTQRALQGFLADEPQGAHAPLAWQRLAQLELSAALAARSPEALRGWLRAWPREPGREKAAAALQELSLAQALAAPAEHRSEALRAFLRDFPEGAGRAAALEALDRAALEEARLLEDEESLRRLARAGGLAEAALEADRVAAAVALARLDAQRLRELAPRLPAPERTRVEGALKALLRALPGLAAEARALFLPGPSDGALPAGPAARARSLGAVARALDGKRLPLVLAETGAPHPWVAGAAFAGAEALLAGLPRSEAILRAARLSAQLEPLALDGPRLGQLSLLQAAAGDGRRARELARAAAAQAAPPVPLLLHALRLEAAGGERQVALLAAEALASAVRASLQARLPTAPAPGAARADAVPAAARTAEQGPSSSLLALCALEESAAAGAALLAALPAGPGEEAAARTRAGAALEEARARAGQAREEAERAQGAREACAAERAWLTARAEEAALRRRKAAQVLRAAGPVGAPALERALARDPDSVVRAVAKGP